MERRGDGPEISVVVPVYNVEAYLQECLDSLLTQTFESVEVICVDDGSQDSSGNICDTYTLRDERVKVIHQNNRGAGAARNVGLAEAKGVYIAFLDADDMYRPNALAKAYACAADHDADVVVFSAEYIARDGTPLGEETLNIGPLLGGTVFSAREIPSHLYQITSCNPWNKLFRREFILSCGIQFQTLRTANDLYFTCSAMACAERITALPEPLALHRVRRSGNLQTLKRDTPLDFLTALEALKNNLQVLGLWDQLEQSFVNFALEQCAYNVQTLNKPGRQQLLQERDRLSELLELRAREDGYYYERSNYWQACQWLSGEKGSKRMGWFARLKEFLKKFLPPPVNAFNREMSALRQFMQGQNSRLRLEQHKETEHVLEILAQQQKQINVQQWQMEAMANKLQEVMSVQQILGQRLLDLGQQMLEQKQQLLLELGQQTSEQKQQLLLELGQQTSEQKQQLLLQLGQQMLERKQQLLLELGQQMLEQKQQMLELDKFAALEESIQTVIAEAKNGIVEEIHVVDSKQSDGITKTQKSIADIKKIVPNQPIFWSNEFEKRVVKENWGDITQLPDFADRFIRLTRGMDAKSVEIVIRILMRQKAYLNADSKSLDLFTRKEQEELRLLKENFKSEIIKLSDNIFAYRNYLLPINHFESSVFYYKHGIADLNNPAAVKGKAIIDVGGFIGDSVLILAELEPSTIYTFEAVPENFELLKKTIELNKIQNVTAENMALGAECGTLTIHICGSGSTAIERPGLAYKEDVEVPVTTLDEYVSKHRIEIGLIKVDIEGGEPAFLEGAKKTICEQRPALLLSIYHNAHDFFELKPMVESWNLGYRFKIHKPTYESATGETLLLAEIED